MEVEVAEGAGDVDLLVGERAAARLTRSSGASRNRVSISAMGCCVARYVL